VTKDPIELREKHKASTREQDIEAELRFWDRVLGEEITEDMKRRILRDPDLVPDWFGRLVADLVIEQGDPLILDIGCGPLSSLAGVEEMGARVIGIDPLRPYYKKILDKNGIRDNCLMLYAEGEDTERLQIFEEQADIVWMCNAIDHSSDPNLVWENLKMLTKPGGHLILLTHINEAERGNMHGMHKINIWPCESGEVCCSVKDGPSFVLSAEGFEVIDIVEKTNPKGIRVLTYHLRKAVSTEG